MFPVNVCSCIKSKRFVEEETQRKRLDSVQDGMRVRDLPFTGGATKMIALRDPMALPFGCSAGLKAWPRPEGVSGLRCSLDYASLRSE